MIPNNRKPKPVSAKVSLKGWGYLFTTIILLLMLFMIIDLTMRALGVM